MVDHALSLTVDHYVDWSTVVILVIDHETLCLTLVFVTGL